MSARIYKLNKSFLTEISSIDLSIPEVSAMAVQHVFDGTVEASYDLPFELQVASRHVPFLRDPEFMIVVREKVEMTAEGSHEQRITSANKDLGKGNYKDSAPSAPWVLPNGFRELRRKSE